MFEVRLRLSKTGKLKYVSHLDMFRIMQRAVRRADIPLWYTEGFNPHPYISFLLALSLGVEGINEPVDIRIIGEMTTSEIKDRLNKVLPEGLEITDCSLPFNKSAEITYGAYDVWYSKEDISADDLFKALSSGELSCQKSGKSGRKKIIKTVNVSEHIKKFSLEEQDDRILLKVILPAGSTFNLNPLQLTQGICDYLGVSLTPVRAVRTALLCEDLSEFR